MTRTRIALATLATLASALGLSACHKPPAAQSAAQQARAVRVVRLEPHQLRGSLQATGDLTPREEAAVLPQVSGYRVSTVLADVGQVVRKGEPLARLDPSLLQAQIAQQQAVLAQAEVQAQQAEDQATRVRGLDTEGVLSQEQINQRRFQARAARANVKAQDAALQELKTRQTLLAVSAPVDGLVLAKAVRPGDLAGTGTNPWFTLARDGEIELQAQLSEDDLARVRLHQSVQVTLPDGVVVNGVVRLISPEVDRQTKLGYVRVTLPVRNDIRAGGFARAVFSDVAGQVLAAPETAIRYDADGASVMIVDADRRVKRVAVRTGQRGSGFVQLLQGPPAGALVVENAASLLLEGDMVRPVEGALPAPPASARR